jgi:hypothetical protein
MVSTLHPLAHFAYSLPILTLFHHSFNKKQTITNTLNCLSYFFLNHQRPLT